MSALRTVFTQKVDTEGEIMRTLKLLPLVALTLGCFTSSVHTEAASSRTTAQSNEAEVRQVELTRFSGHLMVRYGGVRDGEQNGSIYAGV